MGFTELFNQVLQFWDTNRNSLPEWHGLGSRKVGETHRVTILAAIGFNEQAFLEAVLRTDRTPENLEFICIPPFQAMRRGRVQLPGYPLQPGSRVFTVSDQCGETCWGTIAAFLSQPSVGPDRPFWLLSNHHVLSEDEKCAQTASVYGAGNTLLSQQIKPVHFNQSAPNLVDAAIANVGRNDVYPFYRGISVSSPDPADPAIGATVEKLGNATGVTTGICALLCHRVFVAGCHIGNVEFQDQLIIASIDKQPAFVAHGDSGSLVASDGHPSALLFGMSETVPDEKALLPPDFPGVAPFGIATPFSQVIKQLNNSFPPSWHLELDAHAPPERTTSSDTNQNP